MRLILDTVNNLKKLDRFYEMYRLAILKVNLYFYFVSFRLNISDIVDHKSMSQSSRKYSINKAWQQRAYVAYSQTNRKPEDQDNPQN